MNNNNLKAINLINYNGRSINLNEVCMSYTNFNPGQILEAVIYDDMIVIVPALSQNNGAEN
jgi:hypothetical protein